MMNKKLSVIVISITPFDAQGKLDEPALRQHLRRLRDAGVSVYVAGGGSGEAFTFTPDERDRVLAISVEELKGRVTVNAVLPSIIDTPTNRKDMPDADPAAWVTPDEVAQAILWLASEAAGGVTGALLPVSGRV